MSRAMKTVTGRRALPAARTRSRARGISMLPLHHRVYLVLRRKLLQCEFPPTAAQPGEHQLAASFEVSGDTMRRVLDRLAQDGLVDRRHGAGTFPVANSAAAHSDEPTLSYYDFIALTSHTYTDKPLEFSYLSTPALITSRDAGFGPMIPKVLRPRPHEGREVHIVDSYVPGDLAPFVTREDIGNRTLLEILGEHNIHAGTSEFRIGAIAAGADESLNFGVEIGAPLVHATRLSRTLQGRPIEFSRLLGVAELFCYSFTFDSKAVLPNLAANAGAPPRH